MLKKVNILGVGVDPVSVEDVLKWLEQVISAGGKGILANVHVAGLNIAYEQAWFRQFLNEAELVTCDGMGVKLGAALLGQHLPWRFANTDLIWPVAALAQDKGYSLFLLGNPPGVAERAAGRLRERYPKIQVAGTQHGYFDKAPGSPETEDVIRQVNLSRPDILFVGFGMPVQEKWLTENWSRMDARVAVPTGALFEYISGDLRRGPRWMTEHYMEWLARLVISPRRYWKRYLRDNPLFLYRLLKQRWLGIVPK